MSECANLLREPHYRRAGLPVGQGLAEFLGPVSVVVAASRYAVGDPDADSRSVCDQDLACGHGLRGPGGFSRSIPVETAHLAISVPVGSISSHLPWRGPKAQPAATRGPIDPSERKTHFRGDRNSDVVGSLAMLHEAIPERFD